MQLTFSRRQSSAGDSLLEVVTPRLNTAAITATENLLAVLGDQERVGLEIAASDSARWFLVRACDPRAAVGLVRLLAAAYPQAEISDLSGLSPAYPDPSTLSPGEQVATCSLRLRAAPCLPLRTFSDADLCREPGGQADPVLGILAAMDDLPENWRALSQLLLSPAPADWSRGYLTLALEPAGLTQPTAYRYESSGLGVGALAASLTLAALALQAQRLLVAGRWGEVALLAAGLLVLGAGVALLFSRFGRRSVVDPRLVREKVGHPAFRAEVRLSVMAPRATPRSEMERYLARLAGAYGQFALPAGNSLVPGKPSWGKTACRDLNRRQPGRTAPLLNTRELAGLWHLPLQAADVLLLERTGARQRLPLPYTVARGCRVGVSEHQGRAVPVHLPADLLRRHLLLVAKTRRGKSSLLLNLARYVMAEPAAGEPSPCLLLVDPHRDLARAALGLVPPARQGNVVYLDAANAERPFGLNLLDVGLGWERDKAVSNTLAVFRRQFDRYWGPRMEDSFRFALLTLYEANAAIVAADPEGRGRQYTILEVPALLSLPPFRAEALALVTDPVVKGWWSGYYERLDHRLQGEIINPVQTKVQRFAGSRAARAVVGQARSTVDPKGWLAEGAVVIVNTAKGEVGEDTAALIGATLLNLFALVVSEQSTLAPDRRRRATLIVDEFHTMPGADYEAILAELAKYGANLVLATQSLARLDALDRESGRSLRSTLFANLDGLFAYHTSAEDARYLASELGEGIDENDLIDLGEYRCYAKLSTAGERLPVFSVRLDPPPPTEEVLAGRLAEQSAARHGRRWAAVEGELALTLARLETYIERDRGNAQAGTPGGGRARDGRTSTGQEGTVLPKVKTRSENRPTKNNQGRPPQAAFVDEAGRVTLDVERGATERVGASALPGGVC